VSDETSLYGGAVRLGFEPGGGGKKRGYTLNGTLVPSVTEITGIVGGNNDGLLQWAVNQAMDCVREGLKPGQKIDELTIGRLLETAKFAHRRQRDDAAAIGKLVHGWVEDRIKARLGLGPESPKPVNEKALAGVEAFLEWEQRERVQYVASERKIASQKHQYAGTLDILAKLSGALSLLDIKTNKRVSKQHYFQTAGYALALEEESGEPLERRVILHLDKETGQPKIHERTECKADFDAFLAARELYRLVEGR
jgi:hypothetical protein